MQTISTYSTAYNERSVFSLPVKSREKERAVERLLVRLAAVSLFFILLFTGLSLMTGYANGEFVPSPTGEEQIVIVSSGDTLWGIASGIRKEGEDIRRTVYELQIRNHLSSSSLKAGQTIIIPANS